MMDVVLLKEKKAYNDGCGVTKRRKRAAVFEDRQRRNKNFKTSKQQPEMKIKTKRTGHSDLRELLVGARRMW